MAAPKFAITVTVQYYARRQSNFRNGPEVSLVLVYMTYERVCLNWDPSFPLLLSQPFSLHSPKWMAGSREFAVRCETAYVSLEHGRRNFNYIMGLKRLLALVLDFTSICGIAFRICRKSNMRQIIRFSLGLAGYLILDSFSLVSHTIFIEEKETEWIAILSFKSIVIRHVF